MYLFVTYAADRFNPTPVTSMANARHTTFFTPLNPFLALRVLLDSNRYVPYDFTGQDVSWLTRVWLSRPIAAFCWLCVIISVTLALFSTIRVRMIGAKTGTTPWYRRMFGLAARDASVRPARTVGKNPVAWRESVARGKTLTAILARWGFVALGVAVALTIVALYHQGTLNADSFRLTIATVIAAEVVIVALAALNMSATAVSREREDGTLDIILTTPIQPGPYIRGKHRGLIQYLAPMIAVPALTMLITAVYVAADGFGRANGVTITIPNPQGTGTFTVPVLFWEGAIALPLVLGPFIAFCVMIGLYRSIRSKGTISSVIAAVGLVVVVVGVLGLCGMATGSNLSFLGAIFSALSPINLVFAIVYPGETLPSALEGGLAATRTSIVIGSMIAAVVYAAISYGLHTNMKNTFMMTVRRLAGTT
jgi:hypothetical protein